MFKLCQYVPSKLLPKPYKPISLQSLLLRAIFFWPGSALLRSWIRLSDECVFILHSPTAIYKVSKLIRRELRAEERKKLDILSSRLQ